LVKQDGKLLTNHVFDYEKNPNLSVRVRVIDGFDAHFEKIFFLQVEDVFEEPIDRLPIVHTEDALKGRITNSS
jgi:DNA-binding XRE family transcriptional regulator